MKNYKILSISTNSGGNNGTVIIVKANPVKLLKINTGFEERILGATFTSHEDDETELFVFPFSQQNSNYLISEARESDYNNNHFWEVEEYDFFDSFLKLLDGSIKPIHKHKTFINSIDTESTFPEKEFEDLPF